jgi:hypothetical protein
MARAELMAALRRSDVEAKALELMAPYLGSARVRSAIEQTAHSIAG